MPQIPKKLVRPVYWLYGLWVKFDFLKFWKLPRILRAIGKAQEARRRPRSPRVIVFIRDHPHPRDSKVSQCLRDRGWKTILLHRSPPSYDAGRFFDQLASYGDRWDALEKAAAYSPLAYHVASTWNFRTAATLIRYRPGKIVFDNTDQLSAQIRPRHLMSRFGDQVVLERYCLENADGLRCRDMTSQHAKKVLGYRIKGRRILFPDYGWGRIDGSAPEPRDPNSVVLCGSMTLEKSHPEMKSSQYLALFQALAEKGIPVHVYPTLWYPDTDEAEAFRDYTALSERCPNFQVHRPVPPDTLARELSKHTFALYCWGHQMHLGADDPSFYQRRRDYEMSSRLFDFLEAGNTLIAHNGKLIRWLCRRYGIGVVGDRELMRSPNEWLQAQLKGLRRDRRIDREWTMPRQIQRLEKFYESL